MDTTPPNVKREYSPDTEWTSMQTPIMTPEGSQHGSGDEFVEVEAEGGKNKSVSIGDTDAQIFDDASESLSDEISNCDISAKDERNDGDDDGDDDNDDDNDDGKKSTSREQNTGEKEEGNDGSDSNPQSEPTRPIEMAIYDPDADLVLTISPEEGDKDQVEYHFRVSSKALASSSSGWRDLISSVQRATSKEGGSMMTLSVTDDIDSLTIFLKIIHLQFSALPAALTFEEIYDLAQFSEKYAAHEIFLPFTRGWIEPFMPKDMNFKREEWILIAWEFCLGKIFEEWVNFLCLESEARSDGTITYAKIDVSEFFPKACREEYVKYIQHTRKKFVLDLITLFYAWFVCDLCHQRSSLYQNQCNALKDGYLMASLKSLLGKWSWPLNAESIGMCPREFKERLLSVEFESFPVPARIAGRSEDHSKCGISLLKDCATKYLFKESEARGGGKRVLQLPTERFTKERRDVELRMFPK